MGLSVSLSVCDKIADELVQIEGLGESGLVDESATPSLLWILATTNWNDGGIWIDTELWMD